ncbi:MAG: type II toxin-antitoxin system Phd/YefM family antitoxin [Bacteroidales bacterium]|nr:type II toxin-antitoxin system Phd/YefM family antitoxin [Bacteroidales bacterium]
MKTITTSDFRKNQKKYFELAERERLIIHRNKGKSFILVPVDEIEDYPYNPNFIAKLLKGEKDFKSGNYDIVKVDELWK